MQLKYNIIIQRITIFLLFVCCTAIGQVGSFDSNFNVGTGPNDNINAVKCQGDGKIIVAGRFSSFDSQNRNGIVRLNPNGTIDNTFNPGTGIDMDIYSVEIQNDNKIIIAGAFTTYDGISRNRIARINSDGTLDTTFNPALGPNSKVLITKIQADGKILIGGEFSSYNGTQAGFIVRIKSDGSIDPSFNTGTGADNYIEDIAIQKDGKIIAVGRFTDFNGNYLPTIVRLNPDGSVDNSFNPGTGSGGINPYISTVALQKDGKILIGGAFTYFDNISKKCILRLNSNGSIDNSFAIGNGFDTRVTSIKIQSDNKILAFGWFTKYNSITSNFLIRLNPNATIDNTFAIGTGTTGSIFTSDIQLNGDIVIAGIFNSYDGNNSNKICRVKGDAPTYCDNFKINFNNVIDNICEQPASSTISASGGIKPYSYQWINTSSVNDSLANFNVSGVYTAVATDLNGCTDTSSLLIYKEPYRGIDLQSILVSSSFRTGFSAQIKSIAKNSSCNDTNGLIKVILDSKLFYNSATPSPNKISGDTLIWNFSNLQYLSTPFTPQVNVTTSNSAQIGDTIHLRTIITPITGDADTTNNIKDYYYPVINGYDPNDISVNPRGNCAKNYIKNDQVLTYTVRFQNTGNAEAINIAVLDSLSSNLDLNTLRVIASSDTMYTMILPTNVVKFMFDSIMLADSNSNEAASHGYVVFEIKPKANLSNETKIENKVGIYFDFNPAVVTNTVFNTITDGSAYPCVLTSVENIETKNSTLYPNPSTGIFTLTSSTLAQNITVYDQTGRRIMNIMPTQHTTSIDLSTVSNGMYFIQVKSNESVQVLKAVVQK